MEENKEDHHQLWWDSEMIFYHFHVISTVPLCLCASLPLNQSHISSDGLLVTTKKEK